MQPTYPPGLPGSRIWFQKQKGYFISCHRNFTVTPK